MSLMGSHMEVLYVPLSDLLVLMDDECLSLVGLSLIGGIGTPDSVAQLTVSLYLLVQCKLLLKHPPSSVIVILKRMIWYNGFLPDDWVVDRLILAYIFRNARRTLNRLLM